MMKLMLIFSLLFFSACVSNQDFKTQIKDALDEIETFDYDAYDYAIIIPEAGCSGCISEAEDFYKSHKADNIYFIFTKLVSRKDLRLKLGFDVESERNVFIDEELLFLSSDNEINVYPIVVDIRDKEHLKWMFLESGKDLNTLFIEKPMKSIEW